MSKKRNLSKIAGLHTGTDKNGKTFYFGEVNEGSTLLILPNMNGESDGEGRFDFIAYFVPNNRYEQSEIEPEADDAPAKPPVPLEVGITPASPATPPADEKPKEIISAPAIP